MSDRSEIQQEPLKLDKESLQKKTFTHIIKRNGDLEKFDTLKIDEAILKAGSATAELNEKLAHKLSLKVVSILYKKFENISPNVEQIQDIVEHVLIDSVFEETAKAYIIYRRKRAEIREIKKILDVEGLMEDYLNETDWRVKENSNMSYSLQGLNNYISSSVTAKYWLEKMYPDNIKKAHIEGDIHIHDLYLLAAYCSGWDLKDLLLRGFGGVRGKIESAPAKHFRVVLGQIVNFFYTLQGEVAGAVAFSNFDTYLAPFIRYDKLTYDEVKQCLQEFVFNMNVPTRVGFQTPFTNITMDLTPSKLIGEENVIIGGELKKEKYKDYQEEMDQLNRAFAEVMMAGDSKGRVFTFPIPTYNITKDFNWENPVLDPVWEMSAKYGIPYFSNFVNSDIDPDDARSMCCRLRIDNKELRKRGGGLFGANPLTGSIGVVTINLARVGFLSKTRKEFFERLEYLMNVSHESLVLKRKTVEKFTTEGLYPYARVYLDNVAKRFGKYWQNHFSTIGIHGMNEAMINFMDKDMGDVKARNFAIEVMDYMNKRILDFQHETGSLYNLEATPAEGTTYQFARADKKKYPEIKVANEAAFKDGAEPYYTNSSWHPVGYTSDIFELLDAQEEFQIRYTGGTVLHNYLGERINDLKAYKKLVKKIAESYKLPYFTLTPTFSICPKHGYLAGEHKFCPKCDEEIGYKEQLNINLNTKSKVKV